MNRMSIPAAEALVICATLCLLAGGCGPKRPATLFPVKGRVTCKGQPVTCGTIAFYPAEGRMAAGDIGPDGHYSLTTFKSGDGALPGRHRVTVDSKRAPSEPPQPKSRREEKVVFDMPVVNKIQWLVPEVYSRADKTPLSAEVTSGENTIDFNLPSQ